MKYKYRYLTVGEIIKEGDEVFDNLMGKWIPARKSIGQAIKIPDHFHQCRREITMKIEILKPVSVESVTAVSLEAGEKLAHWLMLKRCPYSYDQSIRSAAIIKMPKQYQDRLVQLGFIRVIDEFTPFDIHVQTLDECEWLTLYSHQNDSLQDVWKQLEPHFNKYFINKLRVTKKNLE